MERAAHPAPPVQPPQTKQQQPPPPPSCLVCDESTNLIRACRRCPGHFCQDCLKNAFDRSLEEPSMFPASCCAILQLHTVLPEYSTDKADLYRRKFEEWLTVEKLYCPSPTCSAFIPERKIPKQQQSPPAPSLRDLLLQIVDEVFKCHHSRFFRGNSSISKTEDFAEWAANAIDLDDVKQNAVNGGYDSAAKLSTDMAIIASNARLVMGPWHPISHAAANLYADYSRFLGQLTDRLVTATQSGSQITHQDIFPCPTCLIAICTKCRQKAHPDQDCDTTALDHEETMLAQYGYKRCPRCRQGRSPPSSGAHQALCAPVNLAAGGAARWAGSGLNFGDEPEEPIVQVWSCHHYFQKFATPKDGQNYGNLRYMECNRCFLHVSETGVHFQREPGAEAGAWECVDCRLVVCEGCKEHYEEKDQ
ncbi:hypothetical protein HII31_08910 [Pseudocercospora fuligena]|uniref:Bromo domain-containing protein n=1 Tax=Pseudocercospora fuligena TaxID=685502 RepID=A0A8H6RF41_9PEZI|nr:hypothetical protein HII31_08910 [Pseudocercospora fuligena]